MSDKNDLVLSTNQLTAKPPASTDTLSPMTKYCGTELRSDAHRYAIEFEAADWDEAEAICARNGWTLDGELHMTIKVGPQFGEREADEIIDRLNRGGTTHD